MKIHKANFNSWGATEVYLKTDVVARDAKLKEKARIIDEDAEVLEAYLTGKMDWANDVMPMLLKKAENIRKNVKALLLLEDKEELK